jgi:hypothetical protein
MKISEETMTKPSDCHGKPPLHDLTEVLVPDPSKTPRLILLTGFLGRSDQKDNYRLYRSAEMRRWLDIPQIYLHYARDLGLTDDSPFGGTAVWIKAVSDPDVPELTMSGTTEPVDLMSLQEEWNAADRASEPNDGQPGGRPGGTGGRPTGSGILAPPRRRRVPQPPPGR